MLSNEDHIRRADMARMVLDNELFNEAISGLHESLRRQRLKVKPTDTDGQAKLILAEQIIHQLDTYLRRVIEEGKMAQLQLVKPTLRERVFAR